MTTSPEFARMHLSIVANHGRETNFQPESHISELAMAGPEFVYERQDAAEKNTCQTQTTALIGILT
ncbi:MAG: hypothetical protein ACI89X_000681 [Planctomycetota bacterium]|jgi:hypothetical protein